MDTRIGEEEAMRVVCKTAKNQSTCFRIIRENLLIILSIFGVVAGFSVGFGIRPLNPSEDAMLWIGLPGEMFMRMLTFTIVPLVVSSVISGTASLDPKSNGKISTVALVYLAATNAAGTLLGAAVFFVIKPGDGLVGGESETVITTESKLKVQDLFMDMIRNLFPDNIITACFQTTQTIYKAKQVQETINGTSNMTKEIFERSQGTSPAINMLGLIVISSLVGMAIAKVGEAGQPLVNLFKALSEVIIRVLRWIVWFTPIGVTSLIAASIAAVEDISSTFRSVGLFILAVSICVALFIFLILPLLYFIVIRKNPVRFWCTTVRPMMTAFAPPSSSVAIPDMINVCENKHNVDSRISRFVIPFADALNRPGSCSYIFIAAVFLCQLENADLDTSKYIFIAILTLCTSFAIPSTPNGSIINVIIILSSVNVPTRNVGILLALEWLLDRIRTAAEVLSMVLCAVVTSHFCSPGMIVAADDNNNMHQKDTLTGQTNVLALIDDEKSKGEIPVISNGHISIEITNTKI